MSLRGAGEQGRAHQAPRTICRCCFCIPGSCCSHAREENMVTIPLTPHGPGRPSPFAATKNDHRLSLKHSQAPAPPKQASEYSEDVGLYKARLGFVVSSYKWGWWDTQCPTAATPPATRLSFPSSLQLPKLEKRERKINQQDTKINTLFSARMLQPVPPDVPWWLHNS